MKKNLLILTLALLIALPVFGLAADAAPSVAPEVQATETTPTPPLGGQYGPRWRQTTPGTTAPLTGFVDANNDGICDNCGSELGKNTDAPNFIDENKDGVCDHFGTDQQGQAQGRMQGMMGRMQGMMGRMQGMMGRNQQAQGRDQGMMGRGQQGQGNVQGQSYADANNDGVCDNLGTGTRQNFGPGRNRR
jgi:hypothetical protein